MKHTVLGTAIMLLLMLTTTSETLAQESVWIKKSPNSTYISTIETTPWYLLAGENDGRIWQYPFNGIYKSEDFGETWQMLGLLDCGVTDIEYFDGIIYAATYYKQEGISGLFISDDKGESFLHAGLSFASSNVAATSNTVFLGGYQHGLWISHDHGQTWEQKLGDGTGWTGPKISKIEATETIAIVATTTNVYRSFNDGETWEEMPYLVGKQVSSININDGYIKISATDGIHQSLDFGETWQQIDDANAGAIAYIRGSYYIGKDKTIYKNGVDMQLGAPLTHGNALDFATIFSDPYQIFTVVPYEGVFRYSEPLETFPKDQFLEIPWYTTAQDDLIDKISAYFDHEYPLLGYGYHQEPYTTSKTTVNFLGEEEKIPNLYYSSHNGIDFALPYGTEIKAPAPGYATYYSCTDCGHSIKISHINGYETIYMHLQQDGLITEIPGEVVSVNTGDLLGKVGMTGNTSGPHLHFEVLVDSNGNNVFDDYPDGVVDPFSWQNLKTKDPWPNYSWEDALGQHSGSISNYLWNHQIGRPSIYEAVPQNADSSITTIIKKYIKPYLPISQLDLEYVENTSVAINAYDNFGNGIINFDYGVEITLDLEELNLQKIIKETLKLYVWNNLTNIWEPLPTILDFVNNKLIAETTHLSHFALFGEKSGQNIIETFVILNENEVSFSTNGVKTFYSFNNSFWNEYLEPIYVQSGITPIYYFSIDDSGNTEQTKSYIIKYGLENMWSDKVKITNANFSIQ